MNLLFTLLIVLFLIEVFLFFYLKKLRFIFQWLILKEMDLNFKFSKEKINKFKKNSYESNLGWVTKPNIIKIDYVKSFGEKSKKISKKLNIQTIKEEQDLIHITKNIRRKLFHSETHLFLIGMWMIVRLGNMSFQS